MSTPIAPPTKPEKYMIPVGESDRKRLDALGAIFNPTSMTWITSNNIPKDAKFLDVGCGNGGLTNLFAKTYPGAECVGVDISKEQIDVAKNAAQQEKLTNLTWHVSDVYCLEDLKEKHPGLFDIVHCRFILSHLTDPPKAVDQMLSMVRPGGLLIVEEIGSRLKFEWKQAPVKAMEAWQKMVDLQHKLQQSHKDTSERVIAHLSKTDKVSSFKSRLFDIPIESQLQKSMFRIGAEHGLKKIQEMGKPELIQTFGYEDGETWLNEMRQFESDDSASVMTKNYECIVATKR